MRQRGCRRELELHPCVQVKYNIFERKPEKSGLLKACKDLGVTLVAHSPLQRGLLTGALDSTVPAHVRHVHCRCHHLVLRGRPCLQAGLWRRGRRS